VFVQALKALEHYPTPKSRQALTSTIENEKCFYLIRIDAARSLAKVSGFHCYCNSYIVVPLPTRSCFCLGWLVCQLYYSIIYERILVKLLEGVGLEMENSQLVFGLIWMQIREFFSIF